MQRRRAVQLIVAGTLAPLLFGCGQKGPLYLPQDQLEELKRRKEAREAEREQQPAPPASSGG